MHERPLVRIERLSFLAIGALPPGTLPALATRVSRALALPCAVAPGPPPMETPMVAQGAQADSDALLEWLEGRPHAAGEVLVGITKFDIGSPLFTFFFGRARLHGSAALVSLARLTPEFYGLAADPDRMLARATLETLHELGHVAGLVHCEDYGCVMYRTNNVEAIDVRGDSFCGGCAHLLPQGFLARARG